MSSGEVKESRFPYCITNGAILLAIVLLLHPEISIGEPSAAPEVSLIRIEYVPREPLAPCTDVLGLSAHEGFGWDRLCRMEPAVDPSRYACEIPLRKGAEFFGQIGVRVPYGFNGCTYVGSVMADDSETSMRFWGKRSGDCADNGDSFGSVIIYKDGVLQMLDLRSDEDRFKPCGEDAAQCSFYIWN